MMGRHRANLVVAISISVLIAGGLLTYLWWPHHASVAWGRATTLRGAPGVNLGSSADLYSLSCSSPGDCSAVGSYSVKVNHNRAIIVNERRGQWGKVEVLPGLSAREERLNTGASVVSCSAPGDCSAGGTYAVGDNQLLPFVANESDGVWGRLPCDFDVKNRADRGSVVGMARLLGSGARGLPRWQDPAHARWPCHTQRALWRPPPSPALPVLPAPGRRPHLHRDVGPPGRRAGRSLRTLRAPARLPRRLTCTPFSEPHRGPQARGARPRV